MFYIMIMGLDNIGGFAIPRVMKLYTNPLSSNCRKAVAVAQHLGLDLEEVPVDLLKNEQKTPDFLTINPNGKVPALVDGETTLWESNAIMTYLCSKVDNTDLWPKSAVRYDILRWMFWESQHMTPAAAGIAFEAMIKPRLGLGEPDQRKVEENLEAFGRHAAVLDGHLAENRYLVGDGPTLADFAVAAILALAVKPVFPMDDIPNVVRWLADLHEIPAWKNTAPRMPG